MLSSRFIIICVFLCALSPFTYSQFAGKLVVQAGHTSSINNVRFDRNNNSVLTVSDESIKLWGLGSGRLLHTFEAKSFQGYVNDTTIATSYYTNEKDGIISFWSINTGELIQSFPGYSIDVKESEGLAIIRTNFDADSLALYNLKDMSLLTKLPGVDGGFLDEKPWLLSLTGTAGSIKGEIWDYEKQTLVTTLLGNIVAYNDQFIVLDEDSVLNIVDYKAGEVVQQFSKHDTVFYKAFFTPDNKYLYLVPREKIGRNIYDEPVFRNYSLAILINTSTWEDIDKLQASTSIQKIAFHATKKMLAIEENDSISIFSYPDHTLLNKFIGTMPRFSDSGNYIIATIKEPVAPTKNNLNDGEIRVDSTANFVFAADAYEPPKSKDIACLYDFTTGNALRKYQGGRLPSKQYFDKAGRFLISITDNRTYLWNIAEGRLITSVEGEYPHFYFYADGKTVLLKNDEHYLGGVPMPDNGLPVILKINLEQGTILHTVSTAAAAKNFFTASNGPQMAFCFPNKIVLSSTGENNVVNIPITHPVEKICWSADSKLFAVLFSSAASLKELVVYNETGEKQFSTAARSIYEDFSFTGNNQHLIARVNATDSLTMFGLQNGAVQWMSLPEDHEEIPTTPYSYTDSSTGKTIQKQGRQVTLKFLPLTMKHDATGDFFTVEKDGILYVYDTKKAVLAFKIIGSASNITSYSFTDDFTLAVGYESGLLEKYALKNTGKKTALQFVGSTMHITGDEIITKEGDFLVNNSRDARPLYSFALLDEERYIYKLPSGYYMSSAEGAKQVHYVTAKQEVISFEQLDAQYNRPDMVMQAINPGQTGLINAYKKAYSKRIRNQGLDSAFISRPGKLPQLEIANRPTIKFTQLNGRLALHLKSDKGHAITSVNVWVNSVPVFGTNGLNLSRAMGSVFDSTITIDLSAGTNKIEASVATRSGLESLRVPLYVNYSPAKKPGMKVYFVGYGIDEFKDRKQNLKWCVKDIRDMTALLKKKWGAQLVVDTFFNEQVTTKNILLLKKKLAAASIHDKVIVAFSGHGLLSASYDYYLSSYVTNFKNPASGGIPYEALQNLLDDCPARQKLLLLDACNSGEVDKEELAGETNAGNNEVSELPRTTKGNELLSRAAGPKSSFEWMQLLFSNTAKGSGVSILSASAGTQSAQENDQFGNGVFTYALKEANKKGIKSLSGIKTYVTKRVSELTNDRQKPTARGGMSEMDWELW